MDEGLHQQAMERESTAGIINDEQVRRTERGETDETFLGSDFPLPAGHPQVFEESPVAMETDFSFSEPIQVFNEEDEQAVLPQKSAPRRSARKQLMVESSSDEEPKTSPPRKKSITSNNVAQRVLETIKGMCLDPNNASIGEKKVVALTKLRAKMIPGQKGVQSVPVKLPQEQPPPASTGQTTRATTRASAKKQVEKIGKKRKRAAKEPSFINLDDVIESEVVVNREEIIESRQAQEEVVEKKREALEVQDDQIEPEGQKEEGTEGDAARAEVEEVEEPVEQESPDGAEEIEKEESIPHLDWELTEGGLMMKVRMKLKN